MMPRARLRPLLPLTALALAVLGACSTSGSGAATTSGIVAGSYYRNALVCLDLNNNGRCDANEPSTRTDNNGAYSLSGPANAAVVAEITSDAVHYDPDTKTATTVTDPVVFRAPAQAAAVVSAVSTELVALVEGGEDLATARSQLANRIGVSADVLLSDPNKVADASAKAALKNEIEQMTDRIAGAVAEAGAKGDLPKALCSHLALDIDLKKQIDTVVVIYAENRGFDNLYGLFPGADGVPGVNPTSKGTAAAQKDRDGSEVVGNIIHCKMDKSRFTKENKMVDVRLSYDRGLDRYYGLLDLAEKYGIIKKTGTRFEMPDGSKVFGTKIEADPEKYFTKEVLTQLDEAAGKEFKYGRGESANEVSEESEEPAEV